MLDSEPSYVYWIAFGHKEESNALCSASGRHVLGHDLQTSHRVIGLGNTAVCYTQSFGVDDHRVVVLSARQPSSTFRAWSVRQDPEGHQVSRDMSPCMLFLNFSRLEGETRRVVIKPKSLTEIAIRVLDAFSLCL